MRLSHQKKKRIKQLDKEKYAASLAPLSIFFQIIMKAFITQYQTGNKR